MAVMIAAGTAKAADVWSEPITVPFDFKVEKMTLPAGQYRVEQDFGKDYVFLVNVETGHRVQVLRDGPASAPGNVKVSFQRTVEGYRLSKIS